ncbi:MAG: helix-turn-helix transcriptional regulator [Clostridia bacterium]|nr:helix-turn-helix transcriptional regulator [Clostridia bacterium]
MNKTLYPEKLNDSEKTLWNFNETTHGDNDPMRLTATFLHRHYSIDMHAHSYFEVNFIISGKGYHYTENGKTPVSQGDVFVIRPYEKHGYVETEDLGVYHLCINKNYFNKYYGDLILLEGFLLLFGIEPMVRKNNDTLPYFHVFGEEYEKVKSLFEMLGELNKEKNVAVYLSSYGLALSLIAALCEIYHRKLSERIEKLDDLKVKHRDYNYEQIFLSLDYIHKNYNKKILISDLLAVSLMSKNTFYAEFKKYVRKTPCEYIDNYRVMQSKKLLMETDMTIAEISYFVGFCDQSYFVKMYKKTEGISPSKFRQTLDKNAV